MKMRKITRKKAPRAADVHVGGRLRMRRLMLGISQEKIAAELGVTFQQLQKYEKGTNRISASRLQDLAEILGVPIGYFFEGLSRKGPSTPDFFSSRDGIAITKAFNGIQSKTLRRHLVALMKAIAQEIARG